MPVQHMREIAETAARIMLSRLEENISLPGTCYKLKTSLLPGESIRKI